MSFRMTGLNPEPFRHLYGLSDDALAAHGVKRCIADAKPGFPDRIELRDADPGESVLLLNFKHQPANTPYQASHAIYVREGADIAYDRINEIPEVLCARLISLRAFDGEHMMIDADVVDGRELNEVIGRFLADPNVSYLQAHYAKRGCYAAQIERTTV